MLCVPQGSQGSIRLSSNGLPEAPAAVKKAEVVHPLGVVFKLTAYMCVGRTQRAVSVPCRIMVGVVSIRLTDADVKTDFWRFHSGLLMGNTAQEQVFEALSFKNL